MTDRSRTSAPARGVGEAVGEGAIRRIFPLFVLAMWVVAGVMVGTGTWSGLDTLLLVEAAAICSVVFVNFAYVFNYGYALSVFVLNATVLAVRGPSPVAVVLCALLMLYGLRLAAFTLLRYRSPAYAETTASLKATHRALPLFVKCFVFTQTVTLMTFHVMSSATVATAEADFTVTSVVGLVLVVVGMSTEALADLQKQRAKAAAPAAVVTSGLFARTRHPNYLGEIVFQVGIGVTGLSAAVAWYGHAAVVLAPLYIVALMASMVLRGERTKRSRYGDDSAFGAYVSRSGALLPRLRPRARPGGRGAPAS